jgi:hypothetical protein
VFVSGKAQAQKYCLVTPAKASDTCIVFTAGRGRYFSHTHANGSFEADLCGLDLPHYGRSFEASCDDNEEERVILNSMPLDYPRDASKKMVDYYHRCFDDAVAVLSRECGY